MNYISANYNYKENLFYDYQTKKKEKQNTCTKINFIFAL